MLLQYKSGKFSPAETAKVEAAIKDYAAANNVSVERLCQEGSHKGDLKGAWLTIAECLPERTVQVRGSALLLLCCCEHSVDVYCLS
jgi:hypothetical protein